MAHNSYVRGGVGSGLWTSLPVLHAYMEQLDQYCFQSLNGDLGGSWSPSAPIIIGGQGITLSGGNHHVASGGILIVDTGGNISVDFGGGVAVSSGGIQEFFAGSELKLDAGAIVLSDAATDWRGTYKFHTGALVELQSSGELRLDNGAACNLKSGATLTTDSGSSCVYNGSVTFNSAVSVTSSCTFTGATLTCNAASTVNLQGTVAIASTAAVTCAAAITMSGAGHVNERLFSLTNGDLTKGISDADVFYLPASVYSADHVLTMTSTGAVSGSRVRIFSLDAAFKITVQNDNGSSICLVKHGAGSAGPAAGFHQWVDLMHNGSANGWFIIGGWSA